MYNQFFLTEQLSEGHYTIALGYALAPLFFLSLENALEHSSVRNVLALSIVSAIFLSTAHHPVYVIGLFSIPYVLLWILGTNSNRKIRSIAVVKTLLPTLATCFLLSPHGVCQTYC